MKTNRFVHVLMIALAGFYSSSAESRGTVVYAQGAWAAIDRGAACEALSRSQRPPAKDRAPPEAGITFSTHQPHSGEFHARLSRVPRGDASVMLEIGGQPFLLVARDGWAWSRGPAQAQAIIAAMRGTTAMSITSRDAAGARFTDPYLLNGAPTAIDAAAARCALRNAGKIP